MKRFFLALICLVALFSTASAQFRWAPVAGVTINSLKFKQDLIPISHTVGAEAGLMGELMFPGIGFGMDFGLLYNLEGAKMDMGSRKIWASDGIGDINLRIHTLRVPLHVRFKWTRMEGLEDIVAPFVYGGPEFGFIVGHSKVNTISGDHPFKYAGADLNLAVGGGFEFFHRWQIAVQYTWGMSYVVKTTKLDDFAGRNRQWAVRVAYMF